MEISFISDMKSRQEVVSVLKGKIIDSGDRQGNSRVEIGMQLVLSLLYFYLLLNISSNYAVSEYWQIGILAGGGILFIVSMLYYFINRKIWIFAITAMILAVLFHSYIIHGFALYMDTILEAVGGRTGEYHISVTAGLTEQQNGISYVAFAIVLALIVYLLIRILMKMKSFFWCMFLYLPWIFLYIWFIGTEGVVNVYSIANIAICLTGILLSYIYISLVRRGYPSDKVKKKVLLQVSPVIGVLLIVLIGIPFLAQINGDGLSGWMVSIQENLMQIVENWRYADDILPEGNLQQAGAIEYTEATMLEVTMSKPESLYLRGFTGSIYTGKSWKVTENQTAYEAGNLFYWLHNDGFFALSQLSKVSEILYGENQNTSGNTENQTEIDTSETTISVKNIAADRQYLYVPYELKSIQASENQIDEILWTDGLWGCSEYRLASLGNLVKSYPKIAQTYLNDSQNVGEEVSSLSVYKNDEEHYNEWVYQNYTEISEDTRQVLQDALGEVQWAGSHMDYGEAKKLILSYLDQNLIYQTNVETCPKDIDFLEYLLHTSRQGYDVHYASAAALMYRYCGIPARYVEGYIITKEDVKGLEEESTIKVKQSAAHAWAEIYQDGIGWVPVETCPAYMELMEQPTEISFNQGSQKQQDVLQSVQEPDEELQDTEEQGAKSLFIVLIWLFIIIDILLMIVALILFIIFIVKRRNVIQQRKAGFTVSDSKEAVKNMFLYIIQILDYDGMDMEVSCARNWIPILEKTYSESFIQKFCKTIDILEEALYAEREIGKEELTYVREFMTAVCQDSYNKKNIIEKIQMKWKKRLC